MFKGSSFYNPYDNIDSKTWQKANFHAHSRVWFGLTYGYKSEAEELVKKYKELDYTITGISDYQFINPLSTVPVYEHGTGVFKNHQLSIGSKSVTWKEYLFYQNFHHKQNILSELREDNNVISINHPHLRDAYDGEDFKYLRGYELLEVLNHNYHNSINLWDTILSNGNPVFLVANDDSHDITNPKDFGFAFTLVNTPTVKSNDVVKALKEGKTIGVELEPGADLSAEAKKNHASAIPKLTLVKVENDSLFISFSGMCDTIKLVGQNGVQLIKNLSSTEIKYKIRPEDTYIRAEINQKNQANILMNPVFRTNSKSVEVKKAEIDSAKTWIFRSIIMLITGVVIFLILRKKRKTKKSLVA